MKKTFFLSICLTLLSQICSAGIIIDLDAYFSKELEISAISQCGAQGCTMPLVPGNAQHMMIRNTNGHYSTFLVTILNLERNGDCVININSIHSPAPIDQNIGYALPAFQCDQQGESPLGYIRLRQCVGEVELAHVNFSKEDNLLRIQLQAFEAGLSLYQITVSPIGGQTLTVAPVPHELSPDENQIEDRGDAFTQKNAVTSIAPNPFSQSLKVQSNARETETISLQLLNTNGQTIRTVNYAGGQEAYEFFTQDVPPGFYFLQVKVADSLQTYRVVKL